MTLAHVLASVAILVIVVGAATPAAACFEDRCAAPSVTVGELVPANAPGFHVSTPSGTDQPTHSLKRIDPGSEEMILLKRVGDTLMPESPLVPDGTYLLQTTEICEGVEETVEQRFLVISPALPPPSLDYLDADGANPISVPVFDEAERACVEQTMAGVELSIWATSESYRWAGVMTWETIVDGEPWHPAVAPGWTTDMDDGRHYTALYASCEVGPDFAIADGVTPGEHQIRVRGHIPGTDIVVESNVVTLSVPCECPDGMRWDGFRGACDWHYPADDYPYDCGDPSGRCRGIDYDDVGCSAAGAPTPSLPGLLAAFALVVFRRRVR